MDNNITTQDRKRINELLCDLPELNDMFNIHRKIGEGSFSCVYLASLKYNINNSNNHNYNKLYAIKHLIPVSHPNRIEQELRCLKYIGGCDNVVGIDFCMRRYNTVIFVMPYLPHTKFSEYVLNMDVMETKLYMKNLLTALKRVHKFNIIHRDIKPSNFLYDRENKRFLLVDFGLAQKIDVWPSSQNSHLLKDFYQFDIYKDLPVENTITSQVSGSQQYDQQCAFKRKAEEDQHVKLEPAAKRPLIIDATSHNSQSGLPLKPLQEDHPKISPGGKTCQSNRTTVQADKLEQVKRQVFPDDSENKTNQVSVMSYQNNGIMPTMPTYNMLPNSYYGGGESVLVQSMFNPVVNQSSFNHYSDYSYYLSVKAYLEGLHNINSSMVHPYAVANHYRALMAAHSASLYNAQQATPSNSNISSKSTVVRKTKPETQTGTCRCSGRPQVCLLCLKKGEYKAPRAGTQGFRPPEVLLKYADQTTAVDIWACGVILLSIVSGCFPFFHAPDDITALAEIVTIFGSAKLKNVADILGRQLICSYAKKAMDLRKLCSHLRRRALVKQEEKKVSVNGNKAGSSKTSKFKAPKEITCSDCNLSLAYCVCYHDGQTYSNSNPHMSFDSNGRRMWCGFPDEAFDLLEKLMDPNPHTRITAADALSHPFLADL